MTARGGVELPPTPADDAALLRHIAAGHRDALALAFERFRTDVHAMLTRLYGANPDLEDLVQSTFLALPRAARHHSPPTSARSFVLDLAFQRAYRQRLNRRRRLRLWAAHLHGLEVPEVPVDPEQRASDREQLALFEAALRRLSPSHRDVLILYEVRGMKGEEIARIVGVPANTVWTRLHHGRLALRAVLGPREGR